MIIGNMSLSIMHHASSAWRYGERRDTVEVSARLADSDVHRPLLQARRHLALASKQNKYVRRVTVTFSYFLLRSSCFLDLSSARTRNHSSLPVHSSTSWVIILKVDIRAPSHRWSVHTHNKPSSLQQLASQLTLHTIPMSRFFYDPFTEFDRLFDDAFATRFQSGQQQGNNQNQGQQVARRDGTVSNIFQGPFRPR